ncbi:unnamed protein product [Mytilus coruscus]|uniref:Uncharacterized protein n=1 Tax=Mytilus coruscus TaxID=42192 RepID=A0A6J8ETD8_MYTCO|nr:unnamed protein product [Mytilus coruscus]
MTKKRTFRVENAFCDLSANDESNTSRSSTERIHKHDIACDELYKLNDVRNEVQRAVRSSKMYKADAVHEIPAALIFNDTNGFGKGRSTIDPVTSLKSINETRKCNRLSTSVKFVDLCRKASYCSDRDIVFLKLQSIGIHGKNITLFHPCLRVWNVVCGYMTVK